MPIEVVIKVDGNMQNRMIPLFSSPEALFVKKILSVKLPKVII